MKTPTALGVLCAAVVSSVAKGALALEPDGGFPGLLGPIHVEAAGRVVVSGTELESPLYGAPGPLAGGGVGGRAGAIFRGAYGGLTYMDYLTEAACDESYPGGCGSSHGFSYGVEGGYGLSFERLLLLRAVVGVGDYVNTTDSTTTICQSDHTCASSTSHTAAHSIYIEPQALLALTWSYFFLGLDASVFYLPHIAQPASASTFTSFRFGFQLGARL